MVLPTRKANNVTENLTAQVKNYALYLPAMPEGYARMGIRRQRVRNLKVRPSDLNFIAPSSKLFTYKWCLASAGDYAYRGGSNAITQRSESSWVMGDSGGYQLGTGALKEIDGWGAVAKKPAEIMRRWNASDEVRRRLLRWQELHCDCAVILDIPLWTRNSQHATSPFHYCSIAQLTEMTIDNLRFIDRNRTGAGTCKFLNVLQGENREEEDYWYPKVRDYEFEGWAQGGTVADADGLPRVMGRLLRLRDDGMLGGRRQWFHLLGLSTPPWSVVLTAIQRAVQENTGSPFTISFDSATPFRWAGGFQKYAQPPELTRQLKTWRISSPPFPVGYAAAHENAGQPFPAGSPISKLLTIGDMNPRQSPTARKTFDTFSDHALGNHNCYVFLRAFLDANKLHDQGKSPQEIADATGAIAELFEAEDWASKLEQCAVVLRRAVG